MNNQQDILPPPSPQSYEQPFDSNMPELTDETVASKMSELSGSTQSASSATIQQPSSTVDSQGSGALASAALASSGVHPLQTDIDAEDVDLIEKAWIKKAKDIVAMTLNDPHEQNKQLNKVKSEYIEKRFSKVVKLREE